MKYEYELINHTKLLAYLIGRDGHSFVTVSNNIRLQTLLLPYVSQLVNGELVKSILRLRSTISN